MLPLDLHVLSLSLAFILSQDQTLHCNISIALVYPARMIYIALIGFYYILLTVPDPYSRRNHILYYIFLVQSLKDLFTLPQNKTRFYSRKRLQRYCLFRYKQNFSQTFLQKNHFNLIIR